MTIDLVCSTPSSPAGVRGELLDAVTEALLHAGGPSARAEVVSELVREMYATVEWLHDTDTEFANSPADELTGMERLAAAAQAHARQMRAAGAA